MLYHSAACTVRGGSDVDGTAHDIAMSHFVLQMRLLGNGTSRDTVVDTAVMLKSRFPVYFTVSYGEICREPRV